ncbi:MAG TPA: elongation factor P [Rhodothermales bacterium]|nr:elongation factor P [Bacteroidota bacterium]HRK73146.1 elongation factor P [Rhodothermales bacterium]HRR10220.1 elongation factor P [Rhodothermales bacterium]
MADTSDFRNGLTLVWNGDLWTIIEFMHVKPGKGGAFVRSKLRNVRSGKVVDNTFRAGERVETARVERHQYQFLYEDEMGLHLMHTETYDQIQAPLSKVISGKGFFKIDGQVDVLIHAETGEILTVEVPKTIEVRVEQTDPGLKGDTATGATKPAVIETGATVMVPLFINEGDLIRVDTTTTSGTYLARVNK